MKSMQITTKGTNCNGDRILAAVRPAPTEHTEGPKCNFMSQILKHDSSKKLLYVCMNCKSYLVYLEK